MKARGFVTVIALFVSLVVTDAYAAPATSSQGAERHFREQQTGQLSRIDHALAEGELTFQCAALLYQEQRAVRKKFDDMAKDGSLTAAEVRLSEMMQSYADQNINGRCIAPR